MERIYVLYDSLEFIFVNYIIGYIPCWFLRKWLYRLFGMKIGRGSRINMKVVVQKPRGIVLKERVIVNEFCHLDGRGGLIIENDCSISIYTKIITGGHDKNDPNFSYILAPVWIKDHVWIGADTMILAGTEIAAGCVLCAKSLITKSTESYGIYAGVPAKRIGERKNMNYKIHYYPFFR